MKTRKPTLISLLALVLLSTAAFAVKPVSVQLREGRYLEEMKGDIKGAMDIYEKIAFNAEADKRYIAEAYYRLGMCYLKEGKKDKAASLFQTVIDDYSDQRSSVFLAKREREKIKPAGTDTPPSESTAPKDIPPTQGALDDLTKVITPEPVVIASSPAAYADDVPANLRRLSVTFNHKMTDGNWSWVTWDAPFPERNGDISFNSTKIICSMPVKLQPGKAYLVGINIGRFNSFQSEDGITARPYALVFATKDSAGNPTPIPAEMLNRAKRVNDEVTAYLEETARLDAQEKAISKIGEIKIDDGKPAAKKSIAGSGHAVLLENSSAQTVLKGIRIYGSRYGTAQAPRENFHVWLCDENFKVIKEFQYPYSRFVRGQDKWVSLITEPTVLPQKYVIAAGFNPEQTKGVYVHHDAAGSGSSYTGLPDKGFSKFTDGDWLIRAVVSQTEQTAGPTTSTPATSSLQELIDSAQAGATVTIPNGTYTTPVKVTKSLTLKGQSRTGCIFDVTANEPCIMVDTAGKGQVNIENITFKWQLATSDRSTEHPYTVGFKDTKATISGCNFIPLGNFQRSPVAIRTNGFTDLTIDTCRFTGFEYVICYGDGTTGTLTNSLIMDCGHQGIILYSGAKVTVTGNVIGRSLYHAVRSTGGSLNMTDNLIIENKNRGAYLGNKSSRGVIRNNLFINNAVGVNGFSSSRYAIENNVLMNNSFSGVSMVPSCSMMIENNIFQGNEKGWILFEQEGSNNNTCKQNTFWQNKTDAENMPHTSDSILADPLFTDPENGDFSLKDGPAKQAKQGLTNPDIFPALWKRWQNRNNENDLFGETAPAETDSTITEVSATVKQPTTQDKIAAEDLSRKAWALWGRQNFPLAEDSFKEALKLHPQSTNALNGLGWSQFNQGKSVAAKAAFLDCIALEPDHPAALNGLGWIEKAQGNTQQAIAYWQQSIKAAPGATAALNGLCTTYMETKDYDQAAKYYKMWIKAEPDNADAKAGLKKAQDAMNR